MTSILSQRIEKQLFDNIAPFWCGPAVDNEKGGWLACLSNDLKPDRSQPKGLIVNSRILWAFSAIQRKRPDAAFRRMADRAFDFVMNRFWDSTHGGAFWRINEDGVVLDDSKKIYGQAFYIYSLAEYYLAFNSASALDRAVTLFKLIEQHAFDHAHLGYFEVRRRDWSEAGRDARLSDKDMNEKKSMNNHLHVLEAYTNLYRAWKDPLLEQRLHELIRLFLEHILDRSTLHFHHFFDEEWRVRSNTYTFGHDIEGTWLLCEAAETLNDPELLQQVRDVALRMASVTLNQGVAPDGALCYEGKNGNVIDPGKECWPQAEAVIGFINAFQLSHDDRFLDAATRAYSFIESHLVDRTHGEWFWRINPDGKPDLALPKVSEWKGPYHGTRMCLESMHRLEALGRKT